MEPATPQALAALIEREKEALVATWEEHARELPGARNLKRTELRDHIPLLLDELAEELKHPERSRERHEAFCAAHGESRYENGFDLGQVVEEYKLLRRHITETAERNQVCVVGEANRIISELIDEGIKASVEAYIARRDHAERKHRDEYLKFLVHDLRSPLSAIYYAIMLAERELESLPGNERIMNIQSAIKRNIEQMQTLIAKVLQEEDGIKTAPNIQLTRAPSELATLAEAAIRDLGSLAAVSNTQLVNQVPRGIVADIDRTLIERVFQNLISNAIDSAPRGTVTVGAQESDNDAIQCWVRDDGQGIPEEIKSRIFDQFVTASRQQSGIGLGLPIAKRIIEAHGGRIEIESEASKGTIVRFTLPHAP